MSGVKKKSIVFNEQSDIILLKIVQAVNPFEQGINLWEHVADDLSQQLHLNPPATARTVKTRVERLLKRHNQEEAASAKKTGTNEEVSELKQLMIDVAELNNEAMQVALEAKKGKDQTKKKLIQDAKDGKRMRDAAMKGYVGSDTESSEDESESDSEKENASSENESNGSSLSDDDKNSKKKKASVKKRKNSSDDFDDDESDTKKEHKKKKVKVSRKKPKEDPLFSLLRRKIELDEKKEKRRGTELKERMKQTELLMNIVNNSTAAPKKTQ